MKNEENICQSCTKQRAITTVSLNHKYLLKSKILSYLLINLLLNIIKY